MARTRSVGRRAAKRRAVNPSRKITFHRGVKIEETEFGRFTTGDRDLAGRLR